jgi:hypothetical protein
MQWMSAESCTHRKIAGSRDTAPCDCPAFGVRGGPALGFAPSTNAGGYFSASAMSSTRRRLRGSAWHYRRVLRGRRVLLGRRSRRGRGLSP